MSIGVAILTVSDTASRDASLDKSGPLLRELLGSSSSSGPHTSSEPSFRVVKSAIVADEKIEIVQVVREWASLDNVEWIITTGGTGFGTRDCTPEAISSILERPAPGLVHLLLQSSLQVTPLAALSRPVAGTIGATLIVTLPGSPKAVKENLIALLNAGVVNHAIELIKGNSGNVQNVHGSHQHEHHHDHHHHHHDHHAAPIPKSHDPSLGAHARHRSSPYPLLKLEDALEIVQKECSALNIVSKTVNPSLASHVLAETILAPHDLPLSATTNVDGYAIDSSLGAGVYPVLTPKTFSISSDKSIPSGHIYRINTGSPLPPGTDAVVMVEDTELVRTAPSAAPDGEEDEVEVKLLVGAKPGENTRAPGSDVRKGDIALEKGTLVTPLGGEIGTLAFVGQSKVNVYRKPIVALMSTGNEIIDLQGMLDQQSGERGRDGWTGTFDTNRPSLAAALTGMGYEVVDLGIVSDELEAHTSTMRQALSRADILVTTGGSSMGSSDLLKPVIERHLGGTIHFGRVAVKPGKPTTFATVPTPSMIEGTDRQARKPVFALPGNPASALVMFHIFVVPALRKLGGWDAKSCALPRVTVEIMDDMPLDPRPEFHRVHIRASRTGLKAYSTGGQRSSRVASLAGANGLVALPARPRDGEGKQQLSKGESATAVVIGDIQPEISPT